MRRKRFVFILMLFFIVISSINIIAIHKVKTLSSSITENIIIAEEIIENYFKVWKYSITNYNNIQSHELKKIVDIQDDSFDDYLIYNHSGEVSEKASVNVHSLNSYYKDTGILNKLDINFRNLKKDFQNKDINNKYLTDELLDDYKHLNKVWLLALDSSIALRGFINHTVDISINNLENFAEDFSTLNEISKISDVIINNEVPAESIRYVGLSGSDDNTGTINSPYSSLQKALDDNPEEIYIEAGIYYNQTAIKKNIKNLTIKPYHISTDDNSEIFNNFVEFRGSDSLREWETYKSVYRTEYSGNDYFDSVFVSKEKPIQTSGSRPSYNATLWEGGNNESDYKMRPVMSISDVEAEVGTFYYDGSYVYINPVNITNEFNAIKTEGGINLSGENLTLIDIKSKYYFGTPFNLNGIDSLYAKRLVASHSGTTDGFSLDLTNGVLLDSKAFKNRNDGFNMHFSGNTIFINCYGINNYDDGISHHGYTSGTIIGGVWTGNDKGGISPVNDAKVFIYKSYVAENNYALWNVGNLDGLTVSKESVYKNNLNGFHNGVGQLLSISDTFLDNGENRGEEAVYYKGLEEGI